MTKIIDALQFELFVAEQLLWASMDAVEAQGRGGLAWALFKLHAQKVRQLRQRIAARNSNPSEPETYRTPEVSSTDAGNSAMSGTASALRDTHTSSSRIVRFPNRHMSDATGYGGRDRSNVRYRM